MVCTLSIGTLAEAHKNRIVKEKERMNCEAKKEENMKRRKRERKDESHEVIDKNEGKKKQNG